MAKEATKKPTKGTEAKAKKPEVKAEAKAAPKKKAQAKVAAEKKAETKACKIAKCKRTYRAKGYCKAHYRKWRQGEYGIARYHTCVDEMGCRKPMARGRHGYCEDHFQQYYVKGEAVAHAPKAEPAKKEAAAPAAEKATA